MNDTNTLVLIGRLTQDSKLDYLQSGSAKLDFSVAFTTTKKVQNNWVDETNYLNNLTLWGKVAESLHPYMTKGTLVAIQGHLHMDTWEKGGEKKSILKVVVENVQLLSKAQNTQQTQQQRPQQNMRQSVQVQQNVQQSNQVPNLNANGFQEDIPF